MEARGKCAGMGCRTTPGGRQSPPPAPTPFEGVAFRSSIRNRLSNRVTKTARREVRGSLRHLIDRFAVTDRIIRDNADRWMPLYLDRMDSREEVGQNRNFESLRQRALDGAARP